MKLQNNDYCIKLNAVCKKYPRFKAFPFGKSYTQALCDVDFQADRAEITCLLGPNGAGKTTMLKIIADLVLPDSGTISYGSKQLSTGFVTPNERSFYWRLTGRENLRFFATLHYLHGKERAHRIDKVIEETGINEYADIPYRLYSSGIKQRLNIARALLHEPKLILLDEPTAHLDPLARADFWDFIKERILKERNATVILATHDLQEASVLASQMSVLHKGTIVARGTISELQTRISREQQYVLACKKEDAGSLWQSRTDFQTETIEDIVWIKTKNQQTVKELVLDLVSRDRIPLSLNNNPPSLLDIIRHYTGEEK